MKDSFYFPHDTNAINDPKMMRLLANCGMIGIGIYWTIIEILHQQDDGMISEESYNDYIRFYTQYEGGLFDSSQLNIQQMLIKCGLLVQQDGMIFSNRVLYNKKTRKEIAEKRSLAGKNSALKRASKKGSSTSVEQNSTKERKGKEKKEKDIIEDSIINITSLYDLSISNIYIPVRDFIVKQYNEIPGVKYQADEKGHEQYLYEQIEERKKLTKEVEKKGLNEDHLTRILQWIQQDKFWKNQIGSISKLRRKNKDKIPYWVIMVQHIKSQSEQTKQVTDLSSLK